MTVIISNKVCMKSSHCLDDKKKKKIAGIFLALDKFKRGIFIIWFELSS